MVELGEGWREIIIPPPEEGKRVFLKPNFERLIKKPKWKIVHCGKKLYLRRIPENSSWEEIKNSFSGRLVQFVYRRADCNKGDLKHSFAVQAIKSDDSFMGHVVSMVLGASVASMSEEEEKIWLCDLASPKKFPYDVVRTSQNGWALKENDNPNVKLLYNQQFLIMIVREEFSTTIYFYRTPCTNT